MGDLGFGEWLIVAGLFLGTLVLVLPWPAVAVVVGGIVLWWLVKRWRHFKFWKKRGVKGPPPSLLMGNINDYQARRLKEESFDPKSLMCG